MAEPHSHPAPAYQLTLDGEPVDLRQRLISLNLTDHRGFEADTLDLTLDDSDGALTLPPRNTELRLALGWRGEPLVDKGLYVVDEVEHSGAPDTLTIRARAADLRAGLATQRERSWHQTTLGAIVQTLAEENDLTPQCAPDLASEAIAHEDQTNESAAAFLTRLAERYGAAATVKHGHLLFYPIGKAQSVSGQPLPLTSISRQSGDSHRFQVADRQTYSAVIANYHDVAANKRGAVKWGAEEQAAGQAKAQEKATTSATEQAATQGKPYKDTKLKTKSRAKALRLAKREWKKLQAQRQQQWAGVSVAYDDPNLKAHALTYKGVVKWGDAEQAASLRKAEKQVQRDNTLAMPALPAAEPETAIDLGGESSAKVLRHLYASKHNAEKAAKAEWQRLQQGSAIFSLTLATGNPELMPELPVQVSGFKAQIDQTDWIITRVVHTLTDAGYVNQVEMALRVA